MPDPTPPDQVTEPVVFEVRLRRRAPQDRAAYFASIREQWQRNGRDTAMLDELERALE